MLAIYRLSIRSFYCHVKREAFGRMARIYNSYTFPQKSVIVRLEHFALQFILRLQFYGLAQFLCDQLKSPKSEKDKYIPSNVISSDRNPVFNDDAFLKFFQIFH